jgi:hypothetical protein
MYDWATPRGVLAERPHRKESNAAMMVTIPMMMDAVMVIKAAMVIAIHELHADPGSYCRQGLLVDDLHCDVHSGMIGAVNQRLYDTA